MRETSGAEAFHRAPGRGMTAPGRDPYIGEARRSPRQPRRQPHQRERVMPVELGEEHPRRDVWRAMRDGTRASTLR